MRYKHIGSVRTVVLSLSMLSLLIGVPIIVCGGDYLLEFWPHRTEIHHLLQTADPEDRLPPEFVRHLIDASHQDGDIDWIVARDLLVRFVPASSLHGLSWHAHAALWTLFVRIHLSRDETYGLYCALAFNGHGYGTNALAVSVYSRPLSQLSRLEAATVIIMLRSPSLYVNHTLDPQRLDAQAWKLLGTIKRD
jgi:hypothetical protein